MVNAEPRLTEAQPLQSVAIITRGGKKTGEDARETKPLKVIKPASPKKSYES